MFKKHNWAANTGVPVVEARDLDSFVLAGYCLDNGHGIAFYERDPVQLCQIAQKLYEYLQQIRELNLKRHQFYQSSALK